MEAVKAADPHRDAKTSVTESFRVTKTDSGLISAFRVLGRAYAEELMPLLPSSERDRFLQSILAKQEEPDRWLLLLKHEMRYSGFAHFKIDKDERIGWGFILEYYIITSKRRMGLGTKFFSLIARMLQTKRVEDVWLLTDSSDAESFWRSIGFRFAGELDRETGQKILKAKLTAR